MLSQLRGGFHEEFGVIKLHVRAFLHAPVQNVKIAHQTTLCTVLYVQDVAAAMRDLVARGVLEPDTALR